MEVRQAKEFFSRFPREQHRLLYSHDDTHLYQVRDHAGHAFWSIRIEPSVSSTCNSPSSTESCEPLTPSHSTSLTSLSSVDATAATVTRPSVSKTTSTSRKLGKETRRSVSISDNKASSVSPSTSTLQLRKITPQIRIFNELMKNPHPFLIQPIEAFQDTEDIIFLARATPEAMTLRNYIRNSRKTFGERKLKKLFMSLVNALSFLHTDLKFVHRGLSLDEIFVDPTTEEVIITSFPTALPIGHRTLQSPPEDISLASPERLSLTEITIGPEMDIWSAGVILYHLFFERFPFASREPNAHANRLKTIQKIMTKCYPQPAAFIVVGHSPTDTNQYIVNKEGITEAGMQFVHHIFQDRPSTTSQLMTHPWILKTTGNPILKSGKENEVYADLEDDEPEPQSVASPRPIVTQSTFTSTSTSTSTTTTTSSSIWKKLKRKFF